MIFADLELARRLERAEAAGGASFVEARSRLSPALGAEWIEVGGVYAMFDGPASPVTQTFGLGLFSETTAEDLDRLESFFQERSAPVCHEVSPLSGLKVTDLLSGRGYRPIEFTSVMYQQLPRGSVPCEPVDPRLQARQMVKGEEEAWARISALGWAGQFEFTELLQDLGRVVASTDGSLAFFAHLDGEPIATGMLRCHERVALFAGASTVPEARKQGAQRALLEIRMNTAVAHGCDLGMICAEPGGVSQRNAEREGFRIAYTRTKWLLEG